MAAIACIEMAAGQCKMGKIVTKSMPRLELVAQPNKWTSQAIAVLHPLGVAVTSKFPLPTSARRKNQAQKEVAEKVRRVALQSISFVNPLGINAG